MWFTPSPTAVLRARSARSRSAGGPNTCGPASCIAPYPIRATSRSPPSFHVPAASACVMPPTCPRSPLGARDWQQGATMECVTTMDSAVEVRGEAELRLRTAPIYATARTEMSCAAPDLRTWAVLHETTPEAPAVPSWVPRVPDGFTVRKLYGPAVLVDPRSEPLVRRLESLGATIRISTAVLPETILIDRRVVITAGDPDERPR